MWALDALTKAANKLSIRVSRSQVRRILVADGAFGQQPPLSDSQPLADVIDLDRLRRRELLGGLIHE